MADRNDVLLAMFKQYLDQALHHQNQRSATANILLILSGAAIGLITFDRVLGGEADVGAAFFLIGVGSFGCFWSVKQHERYAFYLERARGYRNKLDESLMNMDMKAINSAAKETIKKKYPHTSRIRVWWLWGGLYLLIAILGIVILGLMWPPLMWIVLLLLGFVIGLLVNSRWPNLAHQIRCSIHRFLFHPPPS
jgi:hypothetical protein